MVWQPYRSGPHIVISWLLRDATRSVDPANAKVWQIYTASHILESMNTMTFVCLKGSVFPLQDKQESTQHPRFLMRMRNNFNWIKQLLAQHSGAGQQHSASQSQ